LITPPLLVPTGADMQGGKRALAYLCQLIRLQNKIAKSYILKAFTQAQHSLGLYQQRSIFIYYLQLQ
jgi:hypothetical protein